MTNFERYRYLKATLNTFQGYSNTPMGILGNMPRGVDDDIWQMAEEFENALKKRIKEVKALDFDTEVQVM